MNYHNVVAIFSSNKCTLLDTEEEFNEKRMTTKKKSAHHVHARYIATCGHENVVVVTNFKCRNTGLLCTACQTTNTSATLSASKQNTIGIEAIGIDILREYLPLDCDIERTPEGCVVDLLFRPSIRADCFENMWLKIQVKTTKTLCHNMQSFSVRPHEYEDDVHFLFVCNSNKKIWSFRKNDLKHIKSKLNISTSSKYKKNEITNDVYGALCHVYETTPLISLESALIPKNAYQQREYSYVLQRETLLPFLSFQCPDIQGLAYDFLVNGKRVQEKVCSAKKRNFFIVTLKRCSGSRMCSDGKRRRKFQPYSNEDFDILWIHIHDTNIMYIIPSQILLMKGYIVSSQSKGSHCLIINPTNNNTWYMPYRFDKDNIDKERLLQLLS